MRMKVFDELLDQDPWFQGLVRARVEERVEQEKMRAELQGAQKTVLTIIKARFPSLTDEVRQQVEGITRLEALEQLAGQIATAPDEATVRQALSTFAA